MPALHCAITSSGVLMMNSGDADHRQAQPCEGVRHAVASFTMPRAMTICWIWLVPS